MSKKTKVAEPSATDLRRRMVLVSEADLRSMREAFAQQRSLTVTVHAPQKTELTEAQRERRKEYRQRPEVRAKQKAYRAARARRLREALRTTNAAPQGEPTNQT
jgi:hypothetical protein